MQRRYALLERAEPTISRDLLSAHIQAALLDLVHRKAGPEAAAPLLALAAAVADHWALSGNARRSWFRLCGISGDGSLPPGLAPRLGN